MILLHLVDEDIERDVEGGDVEEGDKENQAHPLVALLVHFLHEDGAEDGDMGVGKGLRRGKKVAGAPVLDIEELTKKDGIVPSEHLSVYPSMTTWYVFTAEH